MVASGYGPFVKVSQILLVHTLSVDSEMNPSFLLFEYHFSSLCRRGLLLQLSVVAPVAT